MIVLFMPARRVIKENRSWMFLAVGIFLLSGALFYSSTLFSQGNAGKLMDIPMEEFQTLVNIILESHPLIAVMLVFMNNFLSMAQMLLLGALAGLSPLITLSFNGALVGVMAALVAGEGVPLLPVLILGVLPHGVFELFAFFLCGAIGLKFGYHCVASPLEGKTRLQSFKYIWKEAISIIPLVAVLLMAAALIEILITPRLLGLVL